LTNVMNEAATQFEKSHPGVKIILNFASSGTLLRQIERGAPVDVFVSADSETMNLAVRNNLIADGSDRIFSKNKLVMLVRSDLNIADIRSLDNGSVKRIAIGHPRSVPAGRYTQKILEKAGMWEKISNKFIYAQNVRQCLDYATRGEVDVAFVYVTDSRLVQNKLRVVPIEDASLDIQYPMAIVKTTNNPVLAQDFVDFLSSEKMDDLLKRSGFFR
ncbi:MAG: molybdate ABC transporter substrate-binding protein, partial [Betaproteobacteria bacterium]